MFDFFSKSYMDSVKQHAGIVLAKKDERKERKSKVKTDEEIFEDFKYDLLHPFMSVLFSEAEKYQASGEPFVVHKRITVLTENNTNAFYLYHNDGNTWRCSGNALIAKFLKEFFPGINMPGLRLGCKGVQQLLDEFPERFEDLREELRERAEKADEEDEKELEEAEQ